jgi:hypothetical protein
LFHFPYRLAHDNNKIQISAMAAHFLVGVPAGPSGGQASDPIKQGRLSSKHHPKKRVADAFAASTRRKALQGYANRD